MIDDRRALSLWYRAQCSHPNPKVAAKNRRFVVAKLRLAMDTSARSVQESMLMILGDLGRHSGTDLGEICLALLHQLGSPSSPLRSLACCELREMANALGKTPYTMMSPHFDFLSVFLADSLITRPESVAEAMQLMGTTRQTFFNATLDHTLPALVLDRNQQALDMIASILKMGLAQILIEHLAPILAQMFLSSTETEPALDFFLSLLAGLMRSNELSVNKLMTSCIVPFVVMLVVELGSEDADAGQRATTALLKAQRKQNGEVFSADLGSFLKPVMMGVISHLNETLHDVQGKKSVDYKRKIIRSIGALIDKVGDSMASFSPQIMASMQSTLNIVELRHETLRTWRQFMRTLRFADVGPFVGRTTAALVNNWPLFNEDERIIAADIITDIAGYSSHLLGFTDDVVGMDGIPALKEASKRLLGYRDQWSVQTKLEKLLDRIRSKNIAIATTSMTEMRDLLLSQEEEVQKMSREFSDTICKAVRTFLSNANRDGDCLMLRELSYECLGIVGAMDPDRMPPAVEPLSMTLMSNFTDQDETIDFAIHLVRDLLVDAFRATNDTKHQNYLAFAIQELLQFCGFSTSLLSSKGSASNKIKAKWSLLPKDQLETLSPLLESRFTMNDQTSRPFLYPIYPDTPTYREWLQTWTAGLIAKVMSMPNTGSHKSAQDAQRIFGVFRPVLRGQDVTVAHHILPHLVLFLLLSDDASIAEIIRAEILSVLQAQVSMTGPQDKRQLSAQVVFDLMDHLSRWIRLQRVQVPTTNSTKQSDRGSDRASHGNKVQIVESLMSSIDTELMANAALQSHAFARSLRSFEQRIVQLKSQKRETEDLQIYYEHLHQIYAELDEPDGMEGVSTYVISPTLEHQIREHESTGRWTSAQSCWEVRLQQSPDDVSLHLGLLKCLRNLGHYGKHFTHIVVPAS